MQYNAIQYNNLDKWTGQEETFKSQSRVSMDGNFARKTRNPYTTP